MPRIIPVALCGGSGTRLWPLSRELHPKQFVDLGDGSTLFANTLKRGRMVAKNVSPIIVCNEKYRFYVAEALKKADMDAWIILEPVPRNTAPAIAMAAFLAQEVDFDDEGEPLMLVMPSDHYFADDAKFVEAVHKAAPIAASGFIVTFGVQPTSPEKGFGYLRKGEPLPEGGFRVAEFVEKPDANKAARMLEDGEHYWNAGIFLGRPSIFLRELKLHSPDIYEQCAKAWSERSLSGNLVRPGDAFKDCPTNSIDYAVMEHTNLAAMSPLEVGWNDLGSWESFYQNAQRDNGNNACVGQVMLEDVKDSYLHSTGRLIAAIGVSDVAVIETGDAVLVTARHDAQKVKDIVGQIKDSGLEQYRTHPLVYRPWGTYEVLTSGDRFKVKRIVVNPGEKLSLQLHHHRAEHWIVVSGTAEVTNGDKTVIFSENQSTYIPIGQKHKLVNPGIIPLVIIEIQTGAYLGEDDIARLEDPYERPHGA